MNDLDRLAKLSAAIERCRLLQRQHPTEWALDSVESQLVYLRDVERGTCADRSMLSKINLGILAVREIADLDVELETLLHKVSSFVAHMQSGL